MLLASCEKHEVVSSVAQSSILFSVDEITQTKVSYGEQENGGVSAAFEDGDYIGVYAFYNNFYYYYMEYLSFAESVIFANDSLELDGSGGASYSPLKSWTFSTLYGTAPHTLDVVSYYPFTSGYNPKYINVVHDDSGAATLEYYYVGYLGDDSQTDDVVNFNIDFMTATQRYNYSDDTTGFRDAMLALPSIPLSFTRQMASLNIQVTKPDDYSSDIIVTQVDVYCYAYQKFTQTIGANEKIEWSEKSEELLVATATCKITLDKTGRDEVSDEEATNDVDNLLESDNLLYFPPGTDISKVVFTLDGGGSYTWHPHIATIEANTNYILNLELDPARAN